MKIPNVKDLIKGDFNSIELPFYYTKPYDEIIKEINSQILKMYSIKCIANNVNNLTITEDITLNIFVGGYTNLTPIAHFLIMHKVTSELIKNGWRVISTHEEVNNIKIIVNMDQSVIRDIALNDLIDE